MMTDLHTSIIIRPSLFSISFKLPTAILNYLAILDYLPETQHLTVSVKLRIGNPGFFSLSASNILFNGTC